MCRTKQDVMNAAKTRRTAMLALNTEGATYAQIGAQYKISSSRARHLVCQALRDERKEDRRNAVDAELRNCTSLNAIPLWVLHTKLSPKASNCITNLTENPTDGTIGDVIDAINTKLLKMPNCGKLTYAEVVTTLDDLRSSVENNP